MRLLLVGAFPYPHTQGSQIYFQEQAIALREAGVEVELLTYASGQNEDGASSETAPNRALDGFRVHRSAPWTSPRSLRAGPSLSKPLGDLGLAQALRKLLTSSTHDAPIDASNDTSHDATHDAQPKPRYDAVLAHNAEAALVALMGSSKPHPPILYCVHTLMGHELSTYTKRLRLKGFLSSTPSSSGSISKRFGDRLIDASGRVIDRLIARRVQGWVALTQASARVMQQNAKGPGALIPPPIPDPELAPNAQTPNAIEACTKHGLQSNRFFLYSGNLDPYQELGLLGAVTERLAARAESSSSLPIIVASHDPAVRAWAEDYPGITACIVDSPREMQGLLHAARASLVLRMAVGGFPIKLANSLAVGTPALAFHGREWGLVDGENSLICDSRDPSGSIANAIANLSQDDALALRLSRGARELYLDQHRPEVAAAETLALIERVRGFWEQAGAASGV